MPDAFPRYDRPYTHPGPLGAGPMSGETWAMARTDGVLSRRLVGYLVDLLVIAFFTALLWLAIAVIGVITFGLGWALFAVLPFTAIIYSALTVGGPSQATIGMRMAGLRAVDASSGGPVDMITAGVHALLFYLAAGTFVLWCLDVFIGMARADRRLGHDLIVNVMLVRSS